ncbi:MAG: hypothetical protein HYZ00_11400 [Candidatus Hydrogenedentes bacterium]|nr:hypothetical protein [Candidatus Hydrogenedentota bacterium]
MPGMGSVKHGKTAAAWLMVMSLALVGQTAFGYPEFQQYVQKHSGRSVNCALCHEHPDGPEGLKPGQIGSLTAEEMDRLNRARAAFQPGQTVDSPILNDFGDAIIRTLGKQQLLLLRQSPEKLPAALGTESDLDQDSIPDADEYVAGTHPLDPNSGQPWRLFLNNLKRFAFHVAMLVAATLFGLYGLNNFLRWFEASAAETTEHGLEDAEAFRRVETVTHEASRRSRSAAEAGP